jgi:hypothetical protein
MRPGQNKRMRGRNNNRKGPNPLTRSYESNGPDVKIRGTAHHIAEKYLQLARDAHSSGDPVMAESYLQHAEHYFRLIAAAQQAQAQAQLGYQRPAGEAEPDENDEDDEVGSPLDRFASPLERVQPQQPQQQPPQPYQQQPYQPNQPQPYAERPQQERGNGEPRQERSERQGQERQDRQDRPPRQFDRNNGRDRWQSRQDRGPREPRAEQPPREPRMVEESEAPGLPAFITAPPRVAVANEQGPDEAPAPFNPEAVTEAGEGAGFHLRPRRRRRRPAQEGEEFSPAAQDAPAGE